MELTQIKINNGAIQYGFFGKEIEQSLLIAKGISTEKEKNIDSEAAQEAIKKNFGFDDKIFFTVENLKSKSTFTLNEDNIANSFKNNWMIEANATITNLPYVKIGSYNADAVPVLFYDRTTGSIASSIVGWENALNGVIETTLGELNGGLQSKHEDVCVLIGPHIMAQSYEVDVNFHTQWIETKEENEKYFSDRIIDGQKIEGKWNFDLQSMIVDKLTELGLNSNNITKNEIDVGQDKKFFSYRREGFTGGRNLSIIYFELGSVSNPLANGAGLTPQNK